jgi:hypothetical protein
LSEFGVDIELFPLPKPSAFSGQRQDEMEEVKGDQVNQGPIFDIKKFYANIISYDEDQPFATELLGIEGV